MIPFGFEDSAQAFELASALVYVSAARTSSAVSAVADHFVGGNDSADSFYTDYIII